MKVPFFISAILLLAGHAGVAQAQGPRSFQWPHAIPPEVRLVAPAAAQPLSLTGPQGALWLSAPDSGRIAATHWKTGAIIGGTVLGVFGAAAFASLSCYDGPCHNQVLAAIGGFALFGLVGFGLGALVGGQFPAGSP